MFYAAVNNYASETSIGFANTWGVIAFESRAARDAYVAKATDLATRPILRSEIRRYIGEPKKFSGTRYMIGLLANAGIPGAVGEVYVGDVRDGLAIRPLNQ